MGFLTGKKALITGLASDRSIAYGIARAMRDQGAELVLTYQGDKLKGRYQLVQNSTTNASLLYADESFDWIYLDATHAYAEAKRDLEAWYPKVKVGGLVSGHDYQFQHQAIGDGYVFGVKDAVDEFASRRHTRVYSTSEPYLPSFYFLKCTRR